MKKIDLNYFLKLSLVYFLEICSKLNGLKDTATILVIKVESWQRDGDVHHFGVLPGKNAAKQKRQDCPSSAISDKLQYPLQLYLQMKKEYY